MKSKRIALKRPVKIKWEGSRSTENCSHDNKSAPSLLLREPHYRQVIQQPQQTRLARIDLLPLFSTSPADQAENEKSASRPLWNHNMTICYRSLVASTKWLLKARSPVNPHPLSLRNSDDSLLQLFSNGRPPNKTTTEHHWEIFSSHPPSEWKSNNCPGKDCRNNAEPSGQLQQIYVSLPPFVWSQVHLAATLIPVISCALSLIKSLTPSTLAYYLSARRQLNKLKTSENKKASQLCKSKRQHYILVTPKARMRNGNLSGKNPDSSDSMCIPVAIYATVIRRSYDDASSILTPRLHLL